MKLWTEHTATIALTLAVVCLFVLFVHVPQRRQLDQLKQERAAQNEKLQEAQKKCSGLAPLHDRVKALRKAMAHFNQRLPDRSELGEFLKEIVASMKLAQLQSQEIRPQSPISTDRYSKMPIHLSFKGSFRDVCLFLHSIETMTRLTRLEELTITAEDESSTRIKANMVLNIYCTRS